MMDITKDEEVRTQILEAAKRVFQKWGLNKSTMEDIAREAGKGKSTLYYYFKNKEDIFDTIADMTIYELLNEAKKSIAGISSAKGKIKTYIISTLTSVKNNFVIYDVVRGEIKGNKNLTEKIKRQFTTNEEAFIKDILQEGVKTGELSFLDEKELNNAAKTIYGIMSAMELYLFLDNDDTAQIDMAAKLIAKGI
jgi:AcrR family transcriptional regulator